LKIKPSKLADLVNYTLVMLSVIIQKIVLKYEFKRIKCLKESL
jgi:hypothetical protein